MADEGFFLGLKFGEQFERTEALITALEEFEIYEAIIESLWRDGVLFSLGDDSGEVLTAARSEMKIRESIIRVLALKNTPFVV